MDYNIDMEQKLFQKFLKTFNTKNLSEFANDVIERDKNNMVIK